MRCKVRQRLCCKTGLKSAIIYLMKYQKVLLISKNEISTWESCKHITNNLVQGYFKALKEAVVETLRVSEDMSLYSAFIHAKKIKEQNFDLIIWLDHKPNAAIMLEALNVVFDGMDQERKPKFLVHLFGDFVLDCLGWQAAFSALQNYPIHFIAASGRQKKLVDAFFNSKNSLCSVLPFSVDESVFNVDNLVDNRKIYRQHFNAENDFIILYTGRISYQKNVDTIVKIFKSLESFSIRKMQLWIAGPWDDIFLPYAGINGVAGSYYTQFSSGFSSEQDLRVKFLGQLKAPELLKIYHAADLFISLSTYNDEDYGMSVAEALSTGLPCLLSDWGGFSSFAEYSKAVELVKVELTGSGAKVNTEEARKKLMKHLLVDEGNLEKRAVNSKMALDHLSIESGAGNLEALLNEVTFSLVESFTSAFEDMCLSFKKNPLSPFEGEDSQFTDLYGEIYENYIS